MADHHQIVEQIRGFLQQSDQTRNDRLDDLAQTFANLCREANSRLARCQRLLGQGLRSEAIQQADAEPRLLDLVTTLDFAELPDWDEIVDIYALSAPPRLLSEARAALADAYAAAEPLQNLLRNHRRLATQRAPLRSRIAVMRKLAAQDAKNPIWTEDLRVFERARFLQIQTEATEAIRSRDATHLARLLAEVQDRTWVEHPSKALVQGLNKAAAQLREEHMAAALGDLETRLRDALAAQDASAGRAARDEWNALMATSPVDFTDPTWERVDPALKWLEEEDRKAATAQAYESDLHALSIALDSKAAISATELERLERVVLRHGRGIPEKTQRRYETRFRAAAARRTRRARLIWVATTAASACALVLAFYLISGSMRAAKAAELAARVSAHLDKREIEQAEDLLARFEKSDSSLFENDSLHAARNRCRAAREAETERAGQFQDLLDEIRSAPPEEAQPRAVDTARDLARDEAEKRALDDLLEERKTNRRNAREKRESGYRPKLQGLDSAIKRLAQRVGEPTIDLDRLQEELDGSRRELDLLKPLLEKVSTDLQQLAAEVEKRLGGVESLFAQRRSESLARDEITDAAAFNVADASDNLGLFAKRLRDFVREFPKEPSSRAIENTLNEERLWNAVGAWNDLVKGWKKPDGDLNADEARARAAACAAYLRENSLTPDPAAVEDYRRFMESVARRGTGPENPRTALETIFSQSLIANLFMIVVNDGTNPPRRFYARIRPTQSNGKLEVRYIAKKGRDERHEWVLPKDVVSKDPAPQSELAIAVRKLLSDKSTHDHWDDAMLELFKLVSKESEIDPILQVNLLKVVIELAGSASEPLRVALEGAKKLLDGAKLDLDADWTDPNSAELESLRIQAHRLVAAAREKLPHENRVKTERDRLARAVLKIHRSVGWLVRGTDGYVVKHGVALPPDGDLWVILPSDAKRGEWRKVGTINASGKQNLDAGKPSELAEGRPVFMIVPSS